jgi:membrane-bound serine protease (ClpP class)
MDPYLIWALALFLMGLVVALIEVVVPSAGVLALVSLACLVGSLAAAYQLSGWTAAILGLTEGVIVPLAIWGAFKVLPKTSVGRQMILEPPAPSRSGDSSRSFSPAGAPNYEGLVNQTGRASTPLRPSGTAEFSGQRISVVTNGEMVEQGSTVRVVMVEGVRVVVEQIKS